MLTKAEKRRFIRELSRNIVNDALRHVGKMPDDWDGIELRRYLADKFEASVMGYMRDKRDRRRRAYDCAMLERNL